VEVVLWHAIVQAATMATPRKRLCIADSPRSRRNEPEPRVVNRLIGLGLECGDGPIGNATQARPLLNDLPAQERFSVDPDRHLSNVHLFAAAGVDIAGRSSQSVACPAADDSVPSTTPSAKFRKPPPSGAFE
jgi:hypothetical protein